MPEKNSFCFSRKKKNNIMSVSSLKMKFSLKLIKWMANIDWDNDGK